MILITANQIVLHLVGDYVFQSHWMATTKTSSHVAALAHAAAYTIPFALVTSSAPALMLILASHFVIDRWRLARYVVWAKNKLLAPPGHCPPWCDCAATGYPSDTPAWLSVWLMIVCDNVLHVICNSVAIQLFQ